jgi:DNA-binding IclR family transcriptional regulator
VELDRLMRISDPFLLAGSKVMHAYSQRHGLNMLLASYYRDSIMCVDIAWPDPSIPPHFERGLPMSLFRGAMAKIILAHLSSYQLRNVALNNADEIRVAGLGSNWTEFRGYMADLSRQGYAVTHAEMYPGSVGLAAPIFDSDGKILGSMTFAVTEKVWRGSGSEKLTQLIVQAAADATGLIAKTAVPAIPGADARISSSPAARGKGRPTSRGVREETLPKGG